MSDAIAVDSRSDAPAPMRHRWRSRPFSKRVMIVRFVIFGVALYVASVVLPGFTIKPVGGREVYTVLILAAVFGFINAVFKPILQFVALPFALQTAGIVVVLVNVVMFALLDAFANPLIEISGFWWYIAGGLLVGFLAFLLENVFGVPEPILSDLRPETREETA